ncbi:MAG: Cytochrome c1 heme lyase [Geoglossum umbratile]|nr:MAG: Cytochrome c1 heme lyase [Geoglossum umbratile]
MVGSPSSTTEQSACPVDHTTRAAWLEEARKQSNKPRSALPTSGDSCDSSKIDQTLPPSHPSVAATTGPRLGVTREISSIPRADIPPPSGRPANNEQESGASPTGNWIYPSEEMFFNAMRRKQYDPQAADMRTIVPIHNAVNERAWKEIKEWEQGLGAEKCGGPRLHSFSGDVSALTPKARLNMLLGYQAPFDRHDWVVDRCGQRVEYVIDFYSGRAQPGNTSKKLNFYLDVRPKLNSFEGVKMRVGRLLGGWF